MKRGRPVGSIQKTLRCQRCKNDLPRDSFYTSGIGHSHVCKGCNRLDVLERSYRRMATDDLKRLLASRLEQIELIRKVLNDAEVSK